MHWSMMKCEMWKRKFETDFFRRAESFEIGNDSNGLNSELQYSEPEPSMIFRPDILHSQRWLISDTHDNIRGVCKCMQRPLLGLPRISGALRVRTLSNVLKTGQMQRMFGGQHGLNDKIQEYAVVIAQFKIGSLQNIVMTLIWSVFENGYRLRRRTDQNCPWSAHGLPPPPTKIKSAATGLGSPGPEEFVKL